VVNLVKTFGPLIQFMMMMLVPVRNLVPVSKLLRYWNSHFAFCVVAWQLPFVLCTAWQFG
jgi:hypothetical protein